MKSTRRFLAILLSVLMVASNLTPSVKAEGFRYEEEECPRRDSHSDPNSGIWDLIDEAPVSCTDDGFATLQCVYCGFTLQYITESAYGHTWGEWYDAEEATCTTGGVQERFCEECGEFDSRNTEPTGHSMTDWEEAVEATCTNAGLEECFCVECGYTESREISMLDHAYTSWTVAVEATCVSDGLRERGCSNCDLHETEVLPATGVHQWSDWTVVKAATCTENGSRQRSCSECGGVETEAIPVTGHTAGQAAVETPCTAAGPGKIVTRCSLCQTVLSEEELVEEGLMIDATGIQVYVLQAMLTDLGYYTGEISGTYDAALAEAVKAYNQTIGIDSDMAKQATFENLALKLLTDNEVDSFYTCLQAWDLGLAAFSYADVEATSNEDGTHDASYTINGVQFVMGEETYTLQTAQYGIQKTVEAEECYNGNEEHTCIVCGYQPGLDEHPVNRTRKPSLRNDPPSGLPELTGLTYNEYYYLLSWDVYEEATAGYKVLISKYDETTEDYVLKKKVPVEDASLSIEKYLKKYGEGDYFLEVVAKGDNNKTLTQRASIYISYYTQMSAPSDVTYDDASYTIFISDKDLTADSVYVVEIYNADGNVVYSGERIDNYFQILSLGEGFFKDGEEYRVSVTVQDLTGRMSDSDPVETEFTYYEPMYFRIAESTPVYGYYEDGDMIEIDTLDEGEIVRSSGASQDDYLIVVTDTGAVGYVSLEAIEIYVPVFYEVTLAYDTSGTKDVIMTDGFGRIPNFDEYVKKAEELAPYGHYFAGFAHSEASSTYLEADTIIKEDDWFMALYNTYDDAVEVLYNYIDERDTWFGGKYVMIGEEIGELPAMLPDGTGPIEWYTEPNGKGVRVTEKTVLQDQDSCIFNIWPVYAGIPETTITIPLHTPLLTKPDYYASYVTLDYEIEAVVLEYSDDHHFYHVKYKDEMFYVAIDFLCTQNLVITFNSTGGWCDVENIFLKHYMVWENYGCLDGSELPVPTKNGYTFMGWKDTSGWNTELLNSTSGLVTFGVSTMLEAVWMENSAFTTRVLIGSDEREITVYGDDGLTDEIGVIPSGTLAYIFDNNYNVKAKASYVKADNGEYGWVSNQYIIRSYNTIETKIEETRDSVLPIVAKDERGYYIPNDVKLIVPRCTKRVFYADACEKTKDGTYYHIYFSDENNTTEGAGSGWIYLGSKKLVHTVTFDPAGGKVLGDSVIRVESGKPIGALPSASMEGKEFRFWYGNGIVDPSTIITKDCVFEAFYK